MYIWMQCDAKLFRGMDGRPDTRWRTTAANNSTYNKFVLLDICTTLNLLQ